RSLISFVFVKHVFENIHSINYTDEMVYGCTGYTVLISQPHAVARGSFKIKVLPLPGVLSTSIEPSCSCTMLCPIVKPKPLLPLSLASILARRSILSEDLEQ